MVPRAETLRRSPLCLSPRWPPSNLIEYLAYKLTPSLQVEHSRDHLHRWERTHHIEGSLERGVLNTGLNCHVLTCAPLLSLNETRNTQPQSPKFNHKRVPSILVCAEKISIIM